MNNITNTLKSAKKDLESIGKLLEPVDAGSEDIEQKSGQSTKIVQLVLSGGIDIFLNQFNEPYIALPDSSFIAEPLSSKKTEALLFKLFWDKYGKVPGQKAVSDAINLLRGHVLFSNQRHREVHNRIGRYGEILYYDLGDNKHVIHISKDGWKIETDCPIVFQRYSHQKIQIMPQRGGNMKDILPLINITDKASQLLFLTHLPVCFIPDIPRAVFTLSGAPGSAKSTLLKMMRQLIDPSATPLLTHNPDIKELIQTASHQYVIFMDNLSFLPEKLSDVLCRIVTGDAFSKRELWTNDNDVLYSFKRAVGICGVNLVATKPDLLSRSLIIKLELISEDTRREEKVVLDIEFEKIRPFLFGAILDCLVFCLKFAPTLELKTLPRMADHFRYSAAAAQFLGYTVDDLYSASKMNTKNQNEEALDASVVAQVILEFMADKDEWKGTSTDFFKETLEIAEKLKVEKSFPANASVLVKKMKEVETNLLAEGIKAVKGIRTGRGNTVDLSKVGIQRVPHNDDISFIEPTSGSVEGVEPEFPF
ncbi:hypothetical protein KBC89_00315 [Candidatus Woesebacteria bacterium]|nr:hypothetical protein [Candidatus Woesebacteria bacterium]